jgi:hypothetical protein
VENKRITKMLNQEQIRLDSRRDAKSRRMVGRVIGGATATSGIVALGFSVQNMIIHGPDVPYGILISMSGFAVVGGALILKNCRDITKLLRRSERRED